MPVYTICIGSNYNREAMLPLARKQLTALFPSIRFADEEETEPFHFPNPALFSNQVGQLRTDAPIDTVKAQLKKIERMAGRTPEDKECGKVVLDIDLLMCDNLVLKPADMEREYIQKGVASLKLRVDS